MNNKYLKEIMNLIVVSFGGVLLIIGINMFLVPAGVYATGLFGLSQELSELIAGSDKLVQLIFWMINLPIILFGFFKVGRKFLLRTLFAIISISIAEIVIPKDIPLIENQLLSVITGSIIMGLGIGLALKRGGSTGGTDIIATYISIIKGKSFGIVNLLTNSVIITLAGFITKSLETSIYMIISLYVAGIIIDKVHNYNQKISLFIVTTHKELMVASLTNSFIRGVTVLDSTGGYSKQSNNLIMITISKQEVGAVLNCINEVDEKAFVNVYNVARIKGAWADTYAETL